MCLAVTHPELFSIVGGFSSYGLQNFTPKLYQFSKAHDEDSYPIQFWLFAGTKDEYGVIQPNGDFVKVLKDKGLRTEYIEDDADHTNRLAQRLGEFIEFLSENLKW